MQEKLWCKYFMSATLTSVTCEGNLKTSEVASEKGSMRVGHGCGFSVFLDAGDIAMDVPGRV